MEEQQPGALRSLRVIDMVDGQVEMCTRYLADLGADVIKVEPPRGGASRRRTTKSGLALRAATDNANKRGVVIDPHTTPGRVQLVRLLTTADILVTSAGTDELDALDLGDIRDRLPQLIVVSVTDFGLTGPYRAYRGNEWVHAAMAGILCRSGIHDKTPLLPPPPPPPPLDRVVENAVAAQISWAILVAYQNCVATGVGDHVDVSLLETATQVFDPAFGAGPTAGYGRPWFECPSGRPDVGYYYPVFDCADGQVRIAILAVPQWRALWRWLGEPTEFADPKYDRIMERQRAHPQLAPLIAELFGGRTAMDLTTEGQSRGVPIAPVLALRDVPHVEHYRERGAFVELELAPGKQASVPAGYVELDGKRAGIRCPAPQLGNTTMRYARRCRRCPIPLLPAGPVRRSPVAVARWRDCAWLISASSSPARRPAGCSRTTAPR